MRRHALILAAIVSAIPFGACDGGGTGDSATGARADSAGPSGASAAAVSATASATGSASAQVAARPPERALNVMLLTIDAMRSEMPWQGYERPIAPFLTELAKKSVVYTNAYSVSSYTAKSVSALLSGRWPSTLYRSGYFFTAFPEANVFFPELLQKAGVRTMGIHAHKYFDRGMKLEQGFDIWRMVPNLKWNAETDENITSPQLTEIATELLSSKDNTNGRFFLWAHFGDPHDQYVQHPETPKWGRDNRDRYDSEIYFVDMHIKKLLDWAATQPWFAETAIIIGSDHGEAFGEHKQWKHAFHLWENLVHVPLMIAAPGAKAQRIEERRSYIDLTPTIMELLGQKPLPEFVGQSLVPEMYGAEEPKSREPIVLELPADSHNPPTFAIIEGDYKLIREEAARRFKLYDIKNDPTELRDLVDVPAHAAKLAELTALYEKTRAGIPSILPYGGNKLVGGGRAKGPEGPPKSGPEEPAK